MRLPGDSRDELRHSMLVGTDDGNGFSNGPIEIPDRDPILSHARLCTILDGEVAEGVQGEIGQHDDGNLRIVGIPNQVGENA